MEGKVVYVALFGSGKSPEDKVMEKMASYLQDMCVKEKDGMVHAGCFEISSGTSRAKTSTIIDGILEYLQKNDHEIVDVKVSPSGMGDSLLCLTVLVLYK